jgi:hypothetical protein
MRNISQLDKTRLCIDFTKEQIDKMVKNIPFEIDDYKLSQEIIDSLPEDVVSETVIRIGFLKPKSIESLDIGIGFSVDYGNPNPLNSSIFSILGLDFDGWGFHYYGDWVNCITWRKSDIPELQKRLRNIDELLKMVSGINFQEWLLMNEGDQYKLLGQYFSFKPNEYVEDLEKEKTTDQIMIEVSEDGKVNITEKLWFFILVQNGIDGLTELMTEKEVDSFEEVRESFDYLLKGDLDSDEDLSDTMKKFINSVRGKWSYRLFHLYFLGREILKTVKKHGKLRVSYEDEGKGIFHD